jgi:hypothetical protein
MNELFLAGSVSRTNSHLTHYRHLPLPPPSLSHTSSRASWRRASLHIFHPQDARFFPSTRYHCFLRFWSSFRSVLNLCRKKHVFGQAMGAGGHMLGGRRNPCLRVRVSSRHRHRQTPDRRKREREREWKRKRERSRPRAWFFSVRPLGTTGETKNPTKLDQSDSSFFAATLAGFEPTSFDNISTTYRQHIETKPERSEKSSSAEVRPSEILLRGGFEPATPRALPPLSSCATGAS